MGEICDVEDKMPTESYAETVKWHKIEHVSKCILSYLR
jgi:hypothetical protein